MEISRANTKELADYLDQKGFIITAEYMHAMQERIDALEDGMKKILPLVETAKKLINKEQSHE